MRSHAVYPEGKLLGERSRRKRHGQAERFESALEPSEQGFAKELQRITAHLTERLTGLNDCQPEVIRYSAVENPREFFERFRRLGIRRRPELDALVEQARQTIHVIEPQTPRDSNHLRQTVARGCEQIQASVGELLVDGPKRNILRRTGTGGAIWDVPRQSSSMCNLCMIRCTNGVSAKEAAPMKSSPENRA